MDFKLFFWAAFTLSQIFNAQIATAQTLVTHIGDQKYEANPLATGSELTVDGKSTALKAVSYGLRKKKVFGLVNVKVYSAELLVAKPQSLVKSDDQVLASLKAAGPIQLRLTMLRDLTGKQITDSFTEALKANGITTDSGEMKTVLNYIAKMQEFKAGQTFSIIGHVQSDKGYLYLQKPTGDIQAISGDAKLPEQMFSIWFGKPVDEKLADLKKELLK